MAIATSGDREDVGVKGRKNDEKDTLLRTLKRRQVLVGLAMPFSVLAGIPPARD